MAGAPFLSLPPGGALPDDVWWLEAPGGTRLRAAHWHGVRDDAHVVFLNGRTEFVEKVAIPAQALVERGLSVVSLDWRGQGLSDRAVSPALKAHVVDFDEYAQDLATLLLDERVGTLPGRRVAMGHSMGGCILARSLAQGVITADAAILSAPMFGIAMNGAMRAVAKVTIGIARLLGRMDGWPPFGDVATPYALSRADPNVLTSDPEVWAWMVDTARAHPDLNVAMPTMAWFAAANRAMADLRRAARAPAPVLCLLGSDEAVVDPAAVRSGAARLGAELAEIRGARHEVLIEADPMRSEAWRAIDAFLAEQGLGRGG